jgi:drug/metabolite transporter (DMT)-like permease
MILLGELSALLTSFLWSGSSLTFAAAAKRVGSLQLNIDRLILASLFLLITVLSFNLIHSLSFTQVTALAVSGIIGLVIGDSFLFASYNHIGARLSMLIMALAPGMSAVLAYFTLGETLSAWGITGMLVTLAGIAIVVLERKEIPSSGYKISKTGYFYGFMGALGQAAGLLIAKFAFEEGPINGFAATFIRIISATILILPVSLMFRRYKNPIKVYSADRKALSSTLAGTILGPFLGITASLIAVANTKVGIASTLMSLMPVIMLPMLKYIYKEKLGLRAVIGAVVAVAGIAILFLR